MQHKCVIHVTTRYSKRYSPAKTTVCQVIINASDNIRQNIHYVYVVHGSQFMLGSYSNYSQKFYVVKHNRNIIYKNDV